MIRDTRYIFKRIIIGVGIALVLFYLKGCNVYAYSGATDVIWYTNTINGQDVLTNNILWFNADTNYTWTIRSLGCGFDYDTRPVSCDAEKCKLYVDFYFTTNMNFTNWSSVTSGYSWTQYKLGDRLMYNDFSTGYFVKRFIFTPNIWDVYGNSGEFIYYGRDTTISNSGNSVPYGGAFKLVSYKCGLTSDMEQLPNETPAYQQNVSIIQKFDAEYSKLAEIWGVSVDQLREAQAQTTWQERTKQAVDALKDSMNDDSIDSSDQNSKINTIKNSGYNNASISDIVLLPVTLLNSAVTGLSSNSCSPINLGALYGTNLTLPCITSTNMQTWLSSSVYTLIDVLMSFCVILGIRKLVLKIYNTIIYLRDGGGTID